MALAAESSRVSKNAAVKQFGIGEDLTFTLFGWYGDSLVVVANMNHDMMRIDPFERIKLVHKAACLIKRTWDVSDFTFMAEAFCSLDINATRGKSLRELFIEGEAPVKECLTFTHVNDTEVELVTLPYHYVPLAGKKIEWDEPLHNSAAAGLRNVELVQSLMDALTLDPTLVDPETVEMVDFYLEVSTALEKLGFTAQWQFT